MDTNKVLNYDDMIKKADEMAATLTDEQLDEVTEVLNDMQDNSPTTQEFLDAQREAAEYDGEGLVGEAIATIDPATGKIRSLEDADALPYGNMTLEEIAADPSIMAEDIKVENATITDDSIRSVHKDIFGDTPLDHLDLKMIMNAADRYKRGEKFSYYNAMPDVIKEMINSNIGPEYLTKMGNLAKNGQNYAAGQFLEYIIRESVVSTELLDLQTAVNQQIADLNKESKKLVSNIGESQKKYFEESVLKTADELEEAGNKEKADLLRTVSHSFTQSYTMEEFLDAYKLGKCKVKQIQLEKWNRTCTDFNIKYQKTKTVIPELSLLVPVLDRHADKKFDLVVIREFVAAFANYTRNMKPVNLAEHTFMYYFITNILSFDYYDQTNEIDHQFHENLKATINNFLEVILKRRNELGKKGGK